MDFTDLPFVTVGDNGSIQDTWNVSPTGDFARDCATGRKYFQMLQMVMNITGNPVFLVRVIEGQGKKFASWGGIETGFFAAMADELTVE